MSYEDIKKGLSRYTKEVEKKLNPDRISCRLDKRSLEYGSCGPYCCKQCNDRRICEFICQYVFDKECEYERKR